MLSVSTQNYLCRLNEAYRYLELRRNIRARDDLHLPRSTICLFIYPPGRRVPKVRLLIAIGVGRSAVSRC